MFLLYSRSLNKEHEQKFIVINQEHYLMPKSKPTGEEIYNFRKENQELTWKEIGSHYGEPWETLKSREYRYSKKTNASNPKINSDSSYEESPPKSRRHKVNFTDKGFTAELYSESDRIKSLDQLLDACEADLSKWRVARHTVNVWEGGRKKKVIDLTFNNGVMSGFVNDTGEWQLTDFWQIKAIFEPRNEEPYEKALEAFIKEIELRAPVYDASRFSYTPETDGYLLVPNLYDAHFGKRAHRSLKYTLDEALEDFIRIGETITARVLAEPKKVSRILFPVGHDILHVDSLLDKTSHGTWVEMTEDVRLAIDAACEATTRTAEAFATVAPVDIVPVEGNHGRLQTYWLGKVLQAFFRNHPHINVYDMKSERQYYKWGRVGLGLTHDGSKPQELATLFPIEARHMWPDIEWTEWLTGHFHHKKGAIYMVDSIRGTVVRTISALCHMDTYHSLHLYVGAHRAADVLYYHKENGPAGSFPVFVSEL